MHKYQLLRQRAEEFHRLLEEYANVDPDVEDFKNRFQPWYERIQRREIRLPCYDYQLYRYFVNSDLSPLAERYLYGIHETHPLPLASAYMSEAMTDWLSDPSYLEQLRKAGEKPSANLDEDPPPEEEAPLPSSKHPAPSDKSLIGLLRRWLRKSQEPKGS